MQQGDSWYSPLPYTVTSLAEGIRLCVPIMGKINLSPMHLHALNSSKAVVVNFMMFAIQRVS
jgi:hypothetical protein